jgi:hypothetical protein
MQYGRLAGFLTFIYYAKQKENNKLVEVVSKYHTDFSIFDVLAVLTDSPWDLNNDRIVSSRTLNNTQLNLNFICLACLAGVIFVIDMKQLSYQNSSC